MTIIILGASIVTLTIPSVLILRLHIYRKWMKYYVVAALAVMSGVAYALFTFQAVLIFVVPTMIAAFYLDRKLLYFSGAVTIVALFVSHIITGLYMFLPWLEPFESMQDIIRYGALPRCLQYCGCFLLILFMTERYRSLLVNMQPEATPKAVCDTRDDDMK